jgi:hypothetical protein
MVDQDFMQMRRTGDFVLVHKHSGVTLCSGTSCRLIF